MNEIVGSSESATKIPAIFGKARANKKHAHAMFSKWKFSQMFFFWIRDSLSHLCLGYLCELFGF